ncbi:(d)CMP kinase [Alphaproteobacteria bacterium]|nr:(d)CMP kinase [Alphaproteobacteria bacterium]
MTKHIISIDGPAGSGKERIAKYIAKKYNYFHLDSGLLYRRLALLIAQKKIDFKNIFQVKEFIKSLNYISLKNHKNLRTRKISSLSSEIAKIIIIRDYVNYQQQKIVKEVINTVNSNKYNGAVIDGRDIGSKVFKNAKIKLFITVKSEIRAKRRHKQLIELGEKSIYSKILKEINLRDKSDKSRKESPLVVPKKAIIIDNSNSFKSTINQLHKSLEKLN